MNSDSASLAEIAEPKLGVGSAEGASTRPIAAVAPVAKAKNAVAASKAGAGTSDAGPAVVPTSADEARAPVRMAANGYIAASSPGNNAYKIGAHDVLEIAVFKVPELSKSVQVTETGTVNLPLVGDLIVVGKTAQETERELAKRLGAKYLQNPQVSVYVKEYNSQRVTVEGAVKKPGVFPLRGKTSLLQAIASADGFDPNADSTVVVFRMTEKGRSGARFDVSEIRSGQAEDPVLQAGDVIVVGTSMLKEGFNNFVKMLPLVGVFALL